MMMAPAGEEGCIAAVGVRKDCSWGGRGAGDSGVALRAKVGAPVGLRQEPTTATTQGKTAAVSSGISASW